MGQMAGGAALNLHRFVLEYEWPLLVGVALIANRVQRRGSPQLHRPFRPMRIMAIGALNQAFVHPMMKRHLELRLLRQVARVAQLRLRFYQQEFSGLCVVRRMAVYATYSVLAMYGVDGVHMLGAAGVTAKARVIYGFDRSLLEYKNLADIPAAFNVRPARAMARFASLLRRSPLGVEGSFPMWRLRPVVVDIFVAGLTSLRPNIIRRIGRTRSRRCRN